MKSLRLLTLSLAAFALSGPAAGEAPEAPYWVSIRASEVNMRVGPGEDYRILWVYHREHLPLRVLRTLEGWRLVRDPDGAQGWVLARFLSREKSAIVSGKELADMREKGDPSARLLWRVEPGVVGKIGDCANGWCSFAVDQRRGFVPQSHLWGATED